MTDVNRIIIQEMVKDIIDHTKDSNISLVKESDTSDVKTHDNKMDVKIDDRNDLQVVTEEKEPNEETKIETETNDSGTNNKSVSDMDTAEKIIESTSDGDDSGNFSLEESFDNSLSEVKESESDDKINSEEQNKECETLDKTNSEKVVKKKEACEETNSEGKECEIKDDVFIEEKNRTIEPESKNVKASESESEQVKTSNTDSDKSVETAEKLLEMDEKSKQSEEANNTITSETVESSTSTSDLDTADDLVTSSPKSVPKVYGKDDLVSEPIVSSTQNTQGCQTDDTDNEKHNPVVQCAKEDNTPSSNFDNLKLTIDVSCETENFEMARHVSKESVSVSTDTEELSKETTSKRKSVDCSTLTDIPYKAARKSSVDSGTYTEFQEKLIKPLSPRKLSPNSSVMEAQPLSPTKITLKLASPTSPTKRPSQSPSRSDPSSSTTFLSKFESFVNELPDTSQDFEPPYTSPGQSPVVGGNSSKIQDVSNKCEIKSESSQKKAVVPVVGKRPRGRPPKNRTVDPIPVTKHKSHKSRSSSPKHKRSYEKQKSESYALSSKSADNASKYSDSKSQKRNMETPETSSQTQEKKIPKHFVLWSNGQYTLATENNISKFKQSSPLSPTRTVFDTVLSSYGDKDKHSKSSKSNSHASSGKCVHKQDDKSSKRKKSPGRDASQPTLKPLKITISEPPPPSSKKIEKSMIPEPKESSDKTVTAVTKTVTNAAPAITVPSINFSQSKDLPSSSENKVVKTPEYRHQSPFFASLSGAKLTNPHRPTAHLNIPNLNSHFSGTHYLYAQNSYRYTNDRLGSPSFRSLPGLGNTEPKALATGAITAKNPRDLVTPHSAIVTPFLSPLSIPSMMHLPATQTLPTTINNSSNSPKGYSPDSTKSPHQVKHDSHNGFSVSLNSMSNIKTMPNKQSTAVRKTKEKSIDNVISAITEMRAKKETNASEQLTGMDLSMKNRNSQSSSCDKKVNSDKTNRDKDVDKFAFTDDDAVPSKRPCLHVKPEQHKSVSDQNKSV